MKTHIRQCAAVLVVSVAAVAAGCGGSDPQKLITSARAYLAKGDSKSAVIELKTALQKQPDSAEARYLLGKALLVDEEPFGAAVELRKALELKHPREVVLPDLARAMLGHGKHKELIAEFGTATLDHKEAMASLKTSVGLAHLREGAAPEALSAFKEALAASPGYVPAQNAMARQLALSGDRDGSIKAAADTIAQGKADAETWVLQGDLLAFAKGDKDGAIAAYRKGLDVDPTHLPAHVGVMQLLIATSDTPGAAAQLAQMQKARPSHPSTRFFQAHVAYLQGDHKSAKEQVLQLLKLAPDHPGVNQLAGAVELASGSNEQARAYLNKTLQGAPGSVVARRLLASAYLRAGEQAKALVVLQPLLARATPDSVALSLAGEAHMLAGELDKASAMFGQAAKVNPSNTRNLTALARTRFLKGDAVGAVADLEQIAATDTSSVANLELVNTQFRRKDYAAALKAIEGLERKQPGKALTEHLRGVAHLGMKEAQKARASFEKALSIDATYFPAAFNLAALDAADKKPEAAQQRFEAILKRQPGHLRALLSLADLKARSGAPRQEVVDLLTTAVRQNPSEPAAHLGLVNKLLADKQTDAALAAAQQAEAALPNQAAILDALGRAQQAAGQTNQALATYNKIIALFPANPAAHLRIADMKLASKDREAAIDSLRRAVAAKPDALLPLQRLFIAEVQAGRVAEALKLARDIQKRQPGHSLGFVFEGDALRAQKNDAAALVAYKAALGKASAGMVAPRVHGTLTSMGKKADAEQFATSWTKDHPQDAVFALYLADNALGRKDYAAAEAGYRQVAALQPNHFVALNNIAWLLVKSSKPGALPFAEKANEIQPNQPLLMDTLALALAAEKRVDQAIELQKKALALAPASSTLRLTMARLHIQAGQKPQARELLEALAKLGDKLPEQGEVKSLLETL